MSENCTSEAIARQNCELFDCICKMFISLLKYCAEHFSSPGPKVLIEVVVTSLCLFNTTVCVLTEVWNGDPSLEQ